MNAEIRILVDEARFERRDKLGKQYEALLEEWAEAKRRELIEAA